MVVPIYDDNPFAEPVKPVVTWCLIAANLAIFFYEAGASQLALDRMIDTFSLTPAALMGDMSAGVTGGLVFVANDVHSGIELIGAYGSIAGVVVAYVMLRPCAKITVLLGIIPLRISAYWVVGLFVLTQLWNLGASSKSEVAYWCHFGGMLGGGILFPLLKPRRIKLFQCLRPVPDTVVQIGPNPAGRAARFDTLR